MLLTAEHVLHPAALPAVAADFGTAQSQLKITSTYACSLAEPLMGKEPTHRIGQKKQQSTTAILLRGSHSSCRGESLSWTGPYLMACGLHLAAKMQQSREMAAVPHQDTSACRGPSKWLQSPTRVKAPASYAPADKTQPPPLPLHGRAKTLCRKPAAVSDVRARQT